jgi:hypothetical protein
MHINLFQLILRQPYQSLPEPLKRFHETRLGQFEGKATVRGSQGMLARILRKLGGFPEPVSQEVDITLKVIRSESQERWLRNIGTARFSSALTRINSENVLSEDFGLLRFRFSLSVRDERIHWNLVGWSFAGIPMLDDVGPEATVWEGVNANGNYEFAVKIELPLVGVLMDYSGWLDCK